VALAVPRGQAGDYSIFGIGVDRKHILKWLFSKEKATLHALQKVYVYSENALWLLSNLCSGENQTERAADFIPLE
jgi:hypothetical protein